MLRKMLAVSAALVGMNAVPAYAYTSLCQRAYGVRLAVVKKHGHRAPGRNICRQGVNTRRGTRSATVKEKARYLRALKQLNAPAPAYLVKYARPPSTPPAGTLSAYLRPTGIAACIVQRESGGNPTARNGQYLGLAQWSPEAWRRMGGTRYAASPLGASYQEQLRVLSYGLARFGSRDWSPYDGC